MKTLVVLVLMALVMARRRHRKRREEAAAATTDAPKDVKNEFEKGPSCGSAVPAHSKCNIEGVDYGKIKFCGCKYRGTDCNNYNLFVDPTAATPEVLGFFPQKPNKDGKYPDFVFFSMVAGEECYQTCGKVLIFKDVKTASAYVNSKKLESEGKGAAADAASAASEAQGATAPAVAAKKKRVKRRFRKHH